MSKAVRFNEYGDVSVLHVIDVPDPAPGPGEVLIQVKAAGVNPGEASIREGRLHALWPATFPSGEGSDLAGVVIGPHGTNLIARDQAVVLLSTAGLLYVMFVAGLEMDLAMFRKHRQQSLLFGLLCFLIPGSLGVVTGRLLGFDWVAALMLGAVIAPHTLLAYPLASRLGLAKRTAITAAVGGTMLTDTLALMVLFVEACDRV